MCEIVKWVVFVLLCACSISDCRKKQIPIPLLLLLGVVVCVSLFVCETPSGSDRIGGALLGLLLFLVSKCTREAIGYGDSWLIFLMGFYLGGLSALQLLFAASLFAATCSLLVLWKKGWKKSITIPFAPFLGIAYLGVMFI